jgi:hypothetical protein
MLARVSAAQHQWQRGEQKKYTDEEAAANLLCG